MIKCIIFDMDGVLVNTEPLHYRIWKQVFAERGVDIQYDKYAACIGSTADYLYNLILRWYGKDFRCDRTISMRFRELKNELIQKEGIPAVKGSPEAVRKLHERGWRLAVASSSPMTFIELCTQKIGISDCFELLFSGENVPHPKPAPDTFLHAAAQLGVPPRECLVVEDSCNGTRAAKAAGMYCLGLRNPDSGNQDLSAADEIIDSLAELCARAGLLRRSCENDTAF